MLSGRQCEEGKKGLTVSESISRLTWCVQRIAVYFLSVDYKTFIHYFILSLNMFLDAFERNREVNK